MTKQHTTSSIDGARVKSVSESISDAVRRALGLAADKANAYEALQNAAKADRDGREELLGNLASAAAAHSWTEAEVNAGAAVAASAKTNGDKQTAKTRRNFIGDAKKVMHPMVCHRFQHLAEMRDAVWESENKANDQPLRRAARRAQHALMYMCDAVREGIAFDTTLDVTAWAKTKDPARDAKKVAERIKALTEELSDIAGSFPLAALVDAVDCLHMIEASELASVQRNAPVTLEPEPEPAPAPEPIAAAPTIDPAGVEAYFAEQDAGLALAA